MSEAWLDEALTHAGVSYDPALPFEAKLALLVKRIDKIGTGGSEDESDLEDALDLLRRWIEETSQVYPDVSRVKRATKEFLKGFER